MRNLVIQQHQGLINCQKGDCKGGKITWTMKMWNRFWTKFLHDERMCHNSKTSQRQTTVAKKLNLPRTFRKTWWKQNFAKYKTEDGNKTWIFQYNPETEQ